MRIYRLILALAVGANLFCSRLTAAEGIDSVKRENAELRSRLEGVERDLAELKKLLAPPAAPATSATVPSATSSATLTFPPAETEKLKQLANLKGQPVRSSLDLNFYGYVKLDAAYDDSRFSLGNFARWAESESVLKDDRHFSLTANQTRLGVDIAGPTSENLASSGKVEFDLYGGGTGENKPEPMLRHAYARMDWPQYKLSLLAGQTWDIISPLNPNTVNYSVTWWQGNVGYRRPQLRLIKTFDLADRVELKLDAGISRTITGRKAVFKEANDPDTGADAGYPTVAGRVGLSVPVGAKQVASFGISGHHGGEEIQDADLSGDKKFVTWSLNADLRLPLGRIFLLQAEAFIGRNFDSHLGGIGQGVNLVLNREIDAVGGWVALTANPWANWQFNLGAGLDNPDDGDLNGNDNPALDARTRNSVLFGNVFYSLSSNVQLAYELSWLRTTYKANAPGEGSRQQFAVIYKF